MLVAAALTPAARGQKDITLETLARAMEGRLGIYARNVATGDKIAINADKAFPAGRLANLGEAAADSRPAAESRAATATPRELADKLAKLHATWPKTPDFEPRQKLIEDAAANEAAAALTPAMEIGGAGTGIPKEPGIAGYAASPGGDLVFCVMTEGMSSAYTGTMLVPEIVEALVRRLLPPFVEAAPGDAPRGLVLTSLHERKQDPRIFDRPDSDLAVAELRRGAQKLSFGVGDVACVAVLARPQDATRVTVQWWSPSERPEARTTTVLGGRRIGDSLFDRALDKAGPWRVRVSYGGVVVFDEKFFVTGK